MPRLGNFGVLAAAISEGVAQINWAEDTFAFADAYDPDDDRYLGLKTGQNVGVGMSQTAVIVKPDRALRQVEEPIEEPGGGPGEGGGTAGGGGGGEPGGGDGPQMAVYPMRFYARKDLTDPVRVIRDFGDIANEVASHLAKNGEVTVTVEINATSEDGYDDKTRRTVSENATQLGFDTHEFEE